MRPIISQIGSPTYKISKWLLNQFKMFDKFESYSVKNTFEFIEEIKDVKIEEDETLVSLDVVSLYPSIAVGKALKILEEWLISNKLGKKKVNEFIRLTKLCLEKKVFQFNGKFYIQIEGLTMGDPLSGFIAELFMSKTEISVCKEYPEIFLVWKRYVDDIFCKIKINRINEGLTILNAKDSTMKYTVERSKDKKLPFLEVKVINNGGKIEFDIFRKETHVDSYINRKSFHPPAHKVAIFNSLIHRMLNIPLNQERKEKEWNYILDVVKKNGFQTKDIHRLQKKKEYQQRTNEMTQLEKLEKADKKFAPINYHPKYNKEFQKIFKKHGIEISPINKKNIKSQFHSDLKDKIQKKRTSWHLQN